MKKILLLLAALLTSMTTWASTFTVTNSDSTFTVTRDNSSGTETVLYRTVSLSALVGQHFTEAVGSLTYSEGETVKTVTVTETASANIAEKYHFQTGTTRSYRFEVLDQDGFQLAYIDRDITYGIDYQHTADYMNSAVADLVYFDNSGNIKSGIFNKFLDVAYSSTDWIKVTDAGYPQGVHTISTDALYHGSSALRTYLDNNEIRMYATVYFTQTEEADGYQYIQILADNSTTYDKNDTWGEVYDPSISIYKACFEMSYTGDYVADEHYQFFPHRYDYVNKAAEIEAGLSCYSFDYDNSHLYQQKYQSSAYDAPNTGSLNLATTVNNLDIRFDAGGNSTDDWDFKDLKVRLALQDPRAPTVLYNYKVSGGPHRRGNTFYVSVPFSEIVTVSGTPTLSTTWGTLNYVSGSGTNVLTFSGTISDDASGTLTVNSHSGWIEDLADNIFYGNISHDFDIRVIVDYSITYDLAGGTLPEEESNPTTYNYETGTFTLNNPTRPGYTFAGWTGSNGDTPETTVTIEQGSEGDLSYTANWERLDRYYTFDSETGALALLWGEFNRDNKWGPEVRHDDIKSITATSEVSLTGDCSELFAHNYYCESIDLDSVNTSEMTIAYKMFYGGVLLTSLDISDWDTGNVTNMEMMFAYSSMGSIDLSGWNTGSVIYMNSMFRGSTRLKSVNLSGWDLRNVTTLYGMFQGCDSLTSVDFKGWNTSNVQNMAFMFYQCKSIQSLDLSEWNTGNVINMAYMFCECPNLTTIYVGPYWTVLGVNYSSWMFYGSTSIVGGMGTTYNENYTDKTYAYIDNGPSRPGYLTFKLPRYTYDRATGALSLISGEFNSDDNWGDEVVAENVKSVTATNDVNFTGDCSGLFAGFTQCESMDLKNVNTSEMTGAYGMFMNCMSLDTLDLSGWSTANVDDMSNMFSFCPQLSTIYVSLNWTTENVALSNEMFEGCTSLVGGMGTSFDPNKTDKTYAHIDGGLENPGYLTYKASPQYIFSNETGTLKLIWGEFNKDNKWGNDVTTSRIKRVTATSEVSFTGDCSELFYGLYNCESIDLNNVNTSEMTSANKMFYNNGKLGTLDLSGWNTENVTEMSYMFYCCSGLTSLNLSEWNTGNVTNMSYMFAGCWRLDTLDVSGFNTRNVTDMSSMFSNCSGLTSLDVSGFNTGNVTNMYMMFNGCSGLDSLDLSGWNTGNVTSMEYMFLSCSGLTSLDVSGWNTANVTKMNSMFSSCSSLTSLDLSSWNTSHVTTMNSMFGYCRGLTSLDLSGWNTGNVTSMNSMFQICSGLDSLDLSGWNTGNVTDMSYMFSSCSGLTSLDISGWNTGNVTEMNSMFSGCSGLTSLDVSGWNTGMVTKMNYMFNGCTGLGSLDLSGFNTANVTNMSGMFQSCTGLSSLDLSGFNTANVTSMGGMFQSCTGLSSLDVSGWNTAHVTSMDYMFNGCLGLITIYAGEKWSTNSVNYSTGMFSGCTSLVGGKGTAYDPNYIDKTYARIDGGASNPGYFTAKSTALRGDLNNDGVLNVSDVTALIAAILNSTPLDLSVGDVNDDESINVADVTALIFLILNN